MVTDPAKRRKIDMDSKLNDNKPYGIFFSKIREVPETLQPQNTIDFSDILCPSLGTLKCSLQINFLVDLPWLVEQYKIHNVHDKPLTVFYGKLLDESDKNYEIPMNITHKKIIPRDLFGTHHSKLGVYVYDDNSVRVSVSTANLFEKDWNRYNQGVWISPKCPSLPENSSETDGESVTGFKACLLNYLSNHLYEADIFEKYIEKADFSKIKVFLVASTPGYHKLSPGTECHLLRTRDLLKKYCELTKEEYSTWEINAQASSIGSLRRSAAYWLCGDFLTSLKSAKIKLVENEFIDLTGDDETRDDSNATVKLNVIFPSENNVKACLFGEEGGECLSYAAKNYEEQKWIHDYLHHWSADNSSRTSIMPHIKTYCRISPCKKKLAWFLLTSANISVAAWGGKLQINGHSSVMSYELGVLFLPKFFDQEYFNISNQNDSNSFPFIYDPVLKKYSKSDKPYCNVKPFIK